MFKTFDDDNSATWKFQGVPDKPEWFERELTQIAGVNPHGQPVLKVVWGGTEMSDKSHDARLKYSSGVYTDVQGWCYTVDGTTHFVKDIEGIDPSIMIFPDIKTEELGLPRWIIEKWVSPQELEAQHRFRNIKDAQGQVLRDFPREGVYDTYFIVQNLEGEYRELDRVVLDLVFDQYKFEQLPYDEQEKQLAEFQQKRVEKMAAHNEEIWRAARNFDLTLDKEEKERRDEYWANHDYTEEYKKLETGFGQ
jgi:hypothetical protein